MNDKLDQKQENFHVHCFLFGTTRSISNLFEGMIKELNSINNSINFVVLCSHLKTTGRALLFLLHCIFHTYFAFRKRKRKIFWPTPSSCIFLTYKQCFLLNTRDPYFIIIAIRVSLGQVELTWKLNSYEIGAYLNRTTYLSSLYSLDIIHLDNWHDWLSKTNVYTNWIEHQGMNIWFEYTYPLPHELTFSITRPFL